MIIRSDIPLSVSVLSTIFEVNALSLSQTMDLIGVVAMKALSLSLMTSLVLLSTGIAYAYRVLMLSKMR